MPPHNYSGHTLIPHLNILQNLYLTPLSDDDNAFRILYYNLELLPYTLGAAWYALAELARVQHEISEAVTEDSFRDAQVIILPSDARDRMTFEIDAFLEAARRSQNAVIHYLRRGLKKGLPDSLHDLIKRIKKKTLDLPQKVEFNLLKYWEEHGRGLRDYRDLSQHNALVSSDARLFKEPTGRRGLYFVLASNPEDKSPAKLRFGSPPVHAFPYILNEFLALVSILHWLTAGLVPAELKARMALTVFRDGLSLDLVGHVVPDPSTVPAEIERLQSLLARQAPS